MCTASLRENHLLFDMSDDESRRDESSEESGDEDSDDGSYDYGFAGGERSIVWVFATILWSL